MAVIRLEHETFIAADVGSVFAYVADLKNETDWQEDIEALIAVSEGSLCQGFRFIEIRRTYGLRLRWEFEVINLVPDRRIQIASVGAQYPYRGDRIFAATAGGTQVTERGELLLPHVPQLFAPLIGLLSRRALRHAYTRLATIVEKRVRAEVALAAEPF